MIDGAQRIVESIVEARHSQRRLNIIGSGSKRNYSPDVSGDMLTMTEHNGIVAYDPAELVVTARAGTDIRMLQAELAQQGQTLAFEPPQFFGTGTVGGMVSSGLSGPARPWCGSVRDAVLGVELVNGLAERLTFGGQVMKNVAGYDVSRLATGAFGALGALLEVSLRVQPIAEHSMTLCFELDAQDANDKCRQLAQRYVPISGSWWAEGLLHIRLSGSQAGVQHAATELGGERIEADRLWQDVRDQSLGFFKSVSAERVTSDDEQLWRIVVPPAAPVPLVSDNSLGLEWGGGQRWLWHEDSEFVSTYARQNKGWAISLGAQAQVEPNQQRYMRAIKQAFDPQGIFVSPFTSGESVAN